MRRAVNAVRLRADWRPLMGLTPEDAGSLVERVLAEAVIDEATRLHNEDVARAQQANR